MLGFPSPETLYFTYLSVVSSVSGPPFARDCGCLSLPNYYTNLTAVVLSLSALPFPNCLHFIALHNTQPD
jgi:hypothetical protein